MKRRARSRVAEEATLIAVNIALIGIVLVPAYVLAAALLELILQRGAAGPLPGRIAHYARDRWWVPLIYVFCAPLVNFVLRWFAYRRGSLRLRAVAMVVAPLAFAVLFLFFFAARAPSAGALVRSVIPGVLATLAYASVMRLPRAPGVRP